VDVKKRILIVDDDEAVRKYVCRILEGAGYRADTAGTGSEALQKATQHRYALALLNYRLPDMTSERLQTQMHAQMPHLKIAVLGPTPLGLDQLIEIVEEALYTLG